MNHTESVAFRQRERERNFRGAVRTFERAFFSGRRSSIDKGLMLQPGKLNSDHDAKFQDPRKRLSSRQMISKVLCLAAMLAAPILLVGASPSPTMLLSGVGVSDGFVLITRRGVVRRRPLRRLAPPVKASRNGAPRPLSVVHDASRAGE